MRKTRSWGRALALGFIVLATACGSVAKGDPDAGPPVDGRPPDPDAAPASGAVRELDSAGGRVTGGGLVLDVQLGHPFTQLPTSGGGHVLTGAAAVTP